MNTCLVICRTLSGLPAVKKIKSKPPIILASDDARVHEAARSIPGVLDVSFIEKMESFWTVATDVKRVLQKIDEWLCSLNPSLPKEVLAWGTQIEGGITSQRVQDTLLLIRSYLSLFSSFNVAEVHTVAHAGSEWEDEVLRACCKAKSLPFKRHISERLGISISAVKRALMPFAKAGYLLIHEILLGGGRLSTPKASVNLNGAVVFQLCSSLKKHVENVQNVMLSLAELGKRPVGLCWSAVGRLTRPTGYDQLTASGIPAIGLERFVTLRHMVRSLFQAALISMKGRNRFRRLASLNYESVPLAPLLAESVKYFFVAVLPQRIRYACALSACLSDAHPATIKPWGGADFFEGKLALRLLHNDGKWPLYVHYWLGARIPNSPYTDRTYRPDVFLAKSPFEAELAMQEYEIGESQVEIVGQARFEKLHSFAAHNRPEMSRRLLNLPLGGKLYVGVDPSGALRGYQSYREQLELITSVLRATQGMPGLIVVIKPHPSYGIEHLLSLIASYKCNNVIMLPKTTPVEHFLNAIDLIVTKYSTLILEAALLGRCSIAAIFDGEERFKVFGDLPHVVKSGRELRDTLTQLASDDRVFRSWKADQLSRHRELIPRYYLSGNSPASVAAERIIKELKGYGEIRQ